VQVLFGGTLEPFLKAAFISSSGTRPDNRAMWTSCAPSSAIRRAALRPGRRAVLVALVLAGMALPASWAGSKDDHERARAAVASGEVLPLPVVLERLRRTHPGQVLELELERQDARWIYEIKLLQANGQLLKVKLDARTAQLLEARRK